MSKTLSSFIAEHKSIAEEFNGTDDYKLIESAFKKFFNRKPTNDVVWKLHKQLTDLPEMSWEELLAL